MKICAHIKKYKCHFANRSVKCTTNDYSEISGEVKALLFPLIKMFPQVGGQQAADSVVRDENIKVAEQASLGFIRLVLFPQGIIWDDLVQREGRCAVTGLLGGRFANELYCALNNVPQKRFSLRCPPGSSCKTSGSVLTSFWARL